MRYRGLCYRAHNPLWSHTPTSGEGAKRNGGRFNPSGVAALYLSSAAPTALAEYNQGFPHRPQPTTLCAYQVDCDHILDLTDPDQRSAVGISLSDMGCAWEFLLATGKKPPTWLLAERLISRSYAGILAPSFATNAPTDGTNIVLWDWSDAKPHEVLLIDDYKRLPQ